MKMFFTLAVRNLLRNRRRTLVCLTMVIGAIGAIAVFEGFSANVIRKLSTTAVDIQFGNIQVAKRSVFDRKSSALEREDLIDDPGGLAAAVRAIPGVESIAGRLSVFALVSQGESTISARIQAVEPAIDTKMSTHFTFDDGSALTADSDREIIIGSGLNKGLRAKAGDRLTLVVSTFDGTMNAMDVTVKGIFTSEITEIDDYVLFMPLAGVQKLTDTQAVEAFVVRTQRDGEAAAFSGVRKLASDQGLETRGWRELARLFMQTTKFFGVQNALVGGILAILILLGIANTVSIAVVERTAEIGTMRAIGFRRLDVVLIFAIEAFVMGLVGSVIAVPLTLAASELVNALKIPLTIPGASRDITVFVDIVPQAYLIGMAMGIAIPVAAALPSVLRIVRKSVVEALRQGI